MPREGSNIMGLRRHFEGTSRDESMSRAEVQMALMSPPSSGWLRESILKSRDIGPNFDGLQLKSAIFRTVALIALRQTSPDQWTHRIVGLMEFVIMSPAPTTLTAATPGTVRFSVTISYAIAETASDAKRGTAYQ